MTVVSITDGNAVLRFISVLSGLFVIKTIKFVLDRSGKTEKRVFFYVSVNLSPCLTSTVGIFYFLFCRRALLRVVCFTSLYTDRTFKIKELK